jgi:hypothetical protein
MIDSKVSETYSKIEQSKEKYLQEKSFARESLIDEIVENNYHEIIKNVKNNNYSKEDFKKLIFNVVGRTHNIDMI